MGIYSVQTQGTWQQGQICTVSRLECQFAERYPLAPLRVPIARFYSKAFLNPPKFWANNLRNIFAGGGNLSNAPSVPNLSALAQRELNGTRLMAHTQEIAGSFLQFFSLFSYEIPDLGDRKFFHSFLQLFALSCMSH